MSPPAPRRRDRPLVGLLAVAGSLCGLLALILLSRLPGPRPPGAFRQMLVLHGSMAAQLGEVGPELAGPMLHGRSQLEGESVDSWLYALQGRAVTAHRLGELPPLPRNAQELPAPGGDVIAVDFEELTSLCWAEQAVALCVVGNQPIAALKELVALVRRQGPGAAEAAPAH